MALKRAYAYTKLCPVWCLHHEYFFESSSERPHFLSRASFVLVEVAWDFVASFLLSSKSIWTYWTPFERGVSTESSYLVDVPGHRRSSGFSPIYGSI